jgi:hypothetical protein
MRVYWVYNVPLNNFGNLFTAQISLPDLSGLVFASRRRSNPVTLNVKSDKSRWIASPAARKDGPGGKRIR